jgi:hypothetical protein
MRVSGQLHVPAALPPGKRPGTHCIGGWVGPRAGLGGCEKYRPHRDSIPGLFSPYRVAIPTTLSRPTKLPQNWKGSITVPLGP